jgi:DNA-binding transcriptional LysR family regulator
MNFRQLQTFALVAQTLSISHTAQHLNYAQSTVTAQIQALEAELGVPLLYRTGRRITALTPAGEALLTHAHHAARLAQNIHMTINDSTQPSGTLVVGASETVLTYRLPPLLVTYNNMYPEVKLVIRPLRYDDLLPQVNQGQIDVAFLLDQALQHDMSHVTLLTQEALLLVAGSRHRLVGVQNVQPTDLIGETILFTERGCGYRSILEYALLAAGIRPTSNLEFTSLEAIKQCVIAGLGITLLPRVAVERELSSEQLYVLDWQAENVEVYTQIAWREDHAQAPAVAAMLGLSQKMLG